MNGDCRRHAPVVVDAHEMPDVSFQCSEKVAFKWPMTRETDWCGDHEQTPVMGSLSPLPAIVGNTSDASREIAGHIRMVEFNSKNTVWLREDCLASVSYESLLETDHNTGGHKAVDVAHVRKKSGCFLTVYCNPGLVDRFIEIAIRDNRNDVDAIKAVQCPLRAFSLTKDGSGEK
jgi:hypothetical protein